MIKISVLYPNEQGKRFDMDYYMNQHLPMVQRVLGPLGLVSGEVHKGISTPDPNVPPQYLIMAYLTFNSVEEVHGAFMAAGKEVMGDIPNYTDIQPLIQISETVD